MVQTPSRSLRTTLTLAALAFLVSGRAADSLEAGSPSADRPRRFEIVKALRDQPLAFEPNLGQADPEVGFMAHAGSMTVLLGWTEVTFVMAEPEEPAASDALPRRKVQLREPPDSRPTTVRMRPVGGTLGAAVQLEELPGRSHYYLGNDPEKWVRDVPHYAKVVYRQVYPGIDLAFYGKGGQIEYDFAVAPGTDPGAIEIEFEGMEDLSLTPKGELVLRTKAGEIRQARPVSYQESGGVKRAVPSLYVLRDGGRVGFKVGAYDRRRPLIIDPTVITAIPQPGSEVAVDGAGNAYVAGKTLSTWFGTNAFLTRVNSDGTVAYTTYFGGSSYDATLGVAMQWDGTKWFAYLTGHTMSADFPVFGGGFQWGPPPSTPPADAVRDRVILARIDASSGSLQMATYFGGSRGFLSAGVEGRPVDVGEAIAVDPQGYVYLAGITASRDFPTSNAFQAQASGGNYDLLNAFVMKLNPAGSGLVYSTYLHGTYIDEDTQALAIDVDGSGNAYVVGITPAGDFPTTEGAYDRTNRPGDYSGFLTKFGPEGGAPLYSTYLGGDLDDSAVGVAVDPGGNAYVIGDTASTDFLGGPGPFALKLAPVAGQPLGYGKIFGTTRFEDVAVDGDGNAYVAARQSLPADGFVWLISAQGVRLGGWLFNSPGGDACVAVARGGGYLYTVGHSNGQPMVAQLERAEQPLTILPSTTRWKPQRDAAKNITVNFSGPKDLVPATVRLEVTPPGGPTTYTPTIGTVAKLQGTEDQYTFEWTGPWTYEPSPGSVLPIPRGNYSLVVAGKRQGSETEIRSDPPYDKVSLVEVKSVRYLGLPGNALEAEQGGNSRIYAEAKVAPTAADPNPAPLDLVAVQAELDPAVEGQAVPVYLMALDVSDAKPDTTPIPCNIQAGFDNCGSPKAGRFVKPDGSTVDASLPMLLTPTDTTASATFRVSTRQGDNYRLVASTSSAWLTGLYAVIPGRSAEVRHTSGEPLQGSPQLSSVLTVWRTLHLELDYIVSFNAQADQDTLDVGPGRQFTTLTPTILEDASSSPPFVQDPFFRLDHSRQNDWRGADLTLDFHAQDIYEVRDNYSDTVTVRLAQNQPDLTNGVGAPYPSAAYRLSDDTVSALQAQLDLRLATSVFGDAYIKLEEVPQRVEDTEIRLELNPYSPAVNQYIFGPGYSTLPAQVSTSRWYWSISAAVAFEGNPQQDLDPQDETYLNPQGLPVRGMNLGNTKLGNVGVRKYRSAIFFEVMRDLYAKPVMQNIDPNLNRRVTAHEMLHTFGLIHQGSSTDGGLMCANINVFNNGAIGDQITAQQRRDVRAIEEPGVNADNTNYCQP